jgi:ankyrin repeat protein
LNITGFLFTGEEIAHDLLDKRHAEIILPLEEQSREEDVLTSLARCDHRKVLNKIRVERAHAESKNRALLESAKHGRIDCVNLFIGWGADINAVDNEKSNSLHVAILNNRFEIVKPFIDHGIDLNAQDKDGITPLMFAAKAGNCECVENLLKNGAKSNLVAINDYEGWNALHFASEFGNKETVERLVVHGCDVNARTKDKCTSLMLAALKGKNETLQYLLGETKVCIEDIFNKT